MEKITTIACTGDSMITRRVATTSEPAMQALGAILRSADVAFTNLEVLPNDFCGTPVKDCGGTHLAARSWVLDDLVALGFRLFACANNHSLDYGIAGLETTIAALENRGLVYAGIGHSLAQARAPAYLDYSHGSIALLSCSSTFASGQEASDPRPDVPGRPGLNPLRFETVYEVTAEQFASLRAIAEQTSLEQKRLERIALGFLHPPKDPAIFPFLSGHFRVGERAAVRTHPHADDQAAILARIRDAKRRADLVLLSVHAHEAGEHETEPAEFLIHFCRAAIDAGADLIVGHGPHRLRGMELYHGKPIFYSLGNFIAQNELVEFLPSDGYERLRAAPTLQPSELFLLRNDNEQRSFPAHRQYWETVLPVCTFAGDQLQAITVYPVSLGFGEAVHRRGRPRLASGPTAEAILAAFAQLSEPFGVSLSMGDGYATVDLGHRR